MNIYDSEVTKGRSVDYYIYFQNNTSVMDKNSQKADIY